MSEELNPITREEMFLAKAAGQNVPALTPITRVERFLQNLIDHIKSIGTGGGGTGGGGAGGGGAQPDWNAAEGEPGHVLNRPFYSEYGMKTLLEETTLTVSEEAEGAVLIPHAVDLTGVPEVEVIYNGTKYVCPVMEEVVMNDGAEEGATWNFGNLAAMNGGESTGEPFIAQFFDDRLAALAGAYGAIAPIDGSTTFTVSIVGIAEIVHPLPIKYVDMVYPMTVTLDEVFSSGDSLRIEREENYNDFAELLWNGGKIRLVLEHNGAIVVAFSTKFFYDDESHLNVAFPHIGQTDVQGNHMWLVFTNGTWKPPME